MPKVGVPLAMKCGTGSPERDEPVAERLHRRERRLHRLRPGREILIVNVAVISVNARGLSPGSVASS